MRKEIEGTKITLYGNEKNVNRATALIEDIRELLTDSEPENRLLLQQNVIDKVRCDIMYDGNGVYSKKKLLKDFNNIIKNGVKYMSDDLYEFFHLCCGTIAHYNKSGWIEQYPTIYDIKYLFNRNEYGCSVYDHIPEWKADVKEIIKLMECKLGIRERR